MRDSQSSLLTAKVRSDFRIKMKYFLGLFVLGIVCQNALARGLENPVLNDFERRLVRLEARQFSESENLEHRMLQLETHHGTQKGEKTLEKSHLERNYYAISRVEKHDEALTFLQRLENLEKSWEKKLEEHLTKLSSTHEKLSERFSAIQRQVEESQRKALLLKETEKKSEALEQQGFILVKPIPAVNEVHPESGSGDGESELEIGSGYGESENEQPKRETFRKIGSKFYFLEKNEENKKTWAEARAYCKKQHAHLASLQDEGEWRLLSHHGLFPDRTYWIDVHDRYTEGRFISGSSHLPAPFLKWGHREPSSSPGDEDCVELSSVMGHKMNDNNCLVKNFYICEM